MARDRQPNNDKCWKSIHTHAASRHHFFSHYKWQKSEKGINRVFYDIFIEHLPCIFQNYLFLCDYCPQSISDENRITLLFSVLQSPLTLGTHDILYTLLSHLSHPYFYDILACSAADVPDFLLSFEPIKTILTSLLDIFSAWNILPRNIYTIVILLLHLGICSSLISIEASFPNFSLCTFCKSSFCPHHLYPSILVYFFSQSVSCRL